MVITKMTPVADRGGGRARLLALFSIDLAEGVRLHGCRLEQMPDGSMRVRGQSPDGTHPFSFSPAAHDAVVIAANAAYQEGPPADERVCA